MPAPFSFLVFSAQSAVWTWIHRIGGPAAIGVGLLDNSVVPLPGSMDALVIVLTAHRPAMWWYYAVWATAGSVLGGWLTYRLARAGGHEVLEKKVGKKRAEKAYHIFDRYGFASLFFAAIAPPPLPIVPFLMVAGIMQYPRHHFFAALGSGRVVRFLLVAWITHKYGQAIFSFFSNYYKPALYILVGLAVVGGIVGLSFYLRWRKKKREQKQKGAEVHPERAA